MSLEEELLNTYRLETLNPTRWQEANSTAIQESDADMLLIEGASQKETYNMFLNLVNEDTFTKDLNNTMDPLTPGKSIAEVLKSKGSVQDIDVDHAVLSISSKQFNPKKFLKMVHKDDSFQELVTSLNYLDDTIAQKNVELRQLVQHEYLRFVRSKSSLDDILKNFQEMGFGKEDNGLNGLRNAINEANKGSNSLINPIYSKQLREYKLKQSIEFVERNKSLFNLPKLLKNYIAEDDYDNLIHDYKNAKLIKADSSEQQHSKVINRVWEDIENIIDLYRKSISESLQNDENEGDNENENDENFLNNIKKLLELDVYDNPILGWIFLKFDKLSKKFTETFNKFHEKLLNIQLNILSTIDQPDYSSFIKVLVSSNIDTNSSNLVDSIIIVEMWLMINKFITSLYDIILQFVRFWKKVENFFNGSYQKKMNSNYIDLTQHFLQFEQYEIDDILNKKNLFIELVIEKLKQFLNSDQVSLKMLSKPILENSNSLENFGILPPFTNSLSVLRYSPNLLSLVLNLTNELGQLSYNDEHIIDELREFAALVNERFVGSVIASWTNDCHNLAKLENWEKLDSGETLLPLLIFEFQKFIIENFGSAVFAKNNISTKQHQNEVKILKSPSKKLISRIRNEFLRSFEIILESIIQKVIEENNNQLISKSDKNYHKLLTLMNLKKMNKNIIPELIEVFDSKFETSLSKTPNMEIHSGLDKMELTIFDSYITDQRKNLSKIISKEMSSIDWSGILEMPTKPSNYIYQIITVLIQVRTNASKVSVELVPKLLVDLLEYCTANMLKRLRDVSLFTDDALRQVTLDIEFFRKIVGNSMSSNATTNLDLIYKDIFGDNINLKALLANLKPLINKHIASSSLEYHVFNSTF